MLERRRAFRGRVFYGGRLAFHQRYSTLACIIRNYTPFGVKIELDAIEVLPRQLDLIIPSKGVTYAAEVVWQSHREAGLALLPTKITHDEMPLDTMLRLRSTERTLRSLQERLDKFNNEM